MRPIFVYGTLKRGHINYQRLLAGLTVAEEPAWLPNAALYTAGPYPFLVRAVDLVASGATVYGELITVHPDQYDHVLMMLDELEDFRSGRAGNLYEREAIIVLTAGGAREAWVYVAGAVIEAAIRCGALRLIASGVW